MGERENIFCGFFENQIFSFFSGQHYIIPTDSREMECINLGTILNKVNDENVLWNFQVFAKSWEIFAELKINEIKPVQLAADIATSP